LCSVQTAKRASTGRHGKPLWGEKKKQAQNTPRTDFVFRKEVAEKEEDREKVGHALGEGAERPREKDHVKQNQPKGRGRRPKQRFLARDEGNLR